VLIARGWTCLITDGRYAQQAAQECGDIEIHVRSGPIASAVAQVLKGRSVRRLYLQAECVTLAQRDSLQRALPTKRIEAMPDLVRQVRRCKDAVEIHAIRRAICIAQSAFKQLVSRGADGWIGKTERQLAAELDYLMRLAGADGPAFETIVAAGANGSCPHHRPTDERIRRGQAVLIDWGASAGGYCSDLTRVVFIDRIPPKLEQVYKVVRRAQQAGLRAVRPGVSCKMIDQAARRIIDQAGYGDRFVHSLGHGIGRQVHELPVVSGTGQARLRAGMVITIEPGVYLPGVGGIRIEDDVLVTPNGRRRLSSLPSQASAMVLR